MLEEHVYISLGSNKGARRQMLAAAAKQLIFSGNRIIKESLVYETAPWGKSEQPAFLNQVLQIGTLLRPADLMSSLLKIESQLGRIRGTEKWLERPIDIDILFYGSSVVAEERLNIPHPELQNRRFVLIPLVEIAPDFIHPVFKKPVFELLRECKDILEVKVLRG